MKKAEKILALSIIGLAVIFGVTYISLSLFGKQVIVGQIERLTHKKTTVGFFIVTPMLGLEIKDLNVEGLVKIKSISASLSIPGFLTGKIILNSLKLIRPDLTFSKSPAPVVLVSTEKTDTDIIIPLPVKPKDFKFLPLAFKRFKIEGGKVNFIDQSVSPDGIKIVLEDIDCSISNLYLFPRPVVTNFELKGKIPWRKDEIQGQVTLEGWLNYAKKDMRASLKIKNIDAIYLYPYYCAWVDLDKARIEKAKLNFSSEMHGLNNNITAECHMELVDMVRKPLEQGDAEEKASQITNKVLDMFKAVDQGNVELNFVLKTKMDSPQFGFASIKTAFEDKIVKGRSATGIKPEEVLVFPVKIVESGVKSFTDLTRAMIAGVFAIGSEIGKGAGVVLSRDLNTVK